MSLGFEYTIDKEIKKKKLTEEQEAKVIADVSSKFKTYDDKRDRQITMYESLRDEIDLNPDREKDEYSINLNSINSLYKTEQAFIWDNTYSNIPQMYDVEGLDQESDDTADTQKKALDNDFYNMKVERELDKANEYFSRTGEICLFVSWKKKYKKIRRPLSAMETLEQKGVVEFLRGQKHYGVFEEKVYDGAYVSYINPLNLVFDPSINPDNESEWDSCAKVVKHWESYQDIAANKEYKLKKDELKEIKNITEGKDGEDKTQVELIDDVVNGDKLEVLEYWGDYILEGQVLCNWHIIIIARKYLAVFGYNKWIINPIINMSVQRDEESKRGIPDLYSVYDLAKEEERKIRLQNLSQALAFNAPVFAPEDMFPDNEIKMEPGKVIAYKKGIQDPNSIIRINFHLIDNKNDIRFLEDKMSTVSGIFPNMQGDKEEGKATATEIKTKAAGQTTRLARKIDLIKQNAIIPMIRKVAELNANMKFDTDNVYVQQQTVDGNGFEKVEKASIEINDQIRQGKYDYKYTDSNGVAKRLQRNESLMKIATPVWDDPAVGLNKREIVKIGLENEGLESVDRFFQELPTPAPIVPVGGVNPDVTGGL